MEVHNIVQEAVIKTIPMKKKCKKAKWLSEEGLQSAEKRREAKGKGEKERYECRVPKTIQEKLNKNFFKAFLSDQCKEIGINDRKGKTRNLFKKIKDTKGIFHAKKGTIKDRNGMALTEAEDIKSWQEYTEKLYKKEILRTQIITMCDDSSRARHPGM